MSNKIKFISLSLLIALTPYTVNADTPKRRIFYDYLAAQHKDFRTDKAAEYVPVHSGLGTLDYSFGDNISKITNLLDSGKFDFYRVHFINGPGINGGRSAKYEITSGFSKASFDAALRSKKGKIYDYYKARLALYCDLIPKYPNIEFAFSPILEGRVSPDAWAAINQFTVDNCKNNFTLVNSPLEGKNLTNGAKFENHGNSSGSEFISSLDGIEVSDIDVASWLKNSANQSFTGVWSRSYNCRHLSGNWEDPRGRTGCPEDKKFEELAHIVDTRPVPPSTNKPSSCKIVRPFASGWIYKPSSEDYTGSSDSRQNKPVLIIPYKTNQVTILSSNNQIVGTLGYYGSYINPGTWRYYSGYPGGSGKYGYRYEVAATDVSGNPYTWFKVNSNTCLGPVIAGMRQGSFR